jgi:AraC-like DNA-binding protein
MKTAHSSDILQLWRDYRSEVLFGLVLVLINGASTYLSQFIDDYKFDVLFTPMFNIATSVVAISSAWLIFRHTEGIRLRRIWGYVLLAWGIGDLAYLICYLVAPLQVMNMGAEHLSVHELLIGNLLGWVMVLYPTETLRPGWLTPKTIAWQLLPMIALVFLDYIVPLNLWPLIALYPYALLVITLMHIRAYRVWCENNYSSMDNIDVQWIIRYCIMLLIIGANYVYICSGHGHARGFTQQWFVIFMLIYGTDQILFRKNPWQEQSDSSDFNGLSVEQSDSADGLADEASQSEYVRVLESWMEQQKPYLRQDFQLMDLREILPMNRTYLSQFINDSYGCTFYQFVNRYRIEEAKHLLRKSPERKLEDIADACGFSSRISFTRTFTQETGLSPREWGKGKK